MKNVFSSLSIALLIVILASCATPRQSVLKLKKSESQLAPLIAIAKKAVKNPRTIEKNGDIRFTKKTYDWTEGFWPGTCWMLFQETNDVKWKDAALFGQGLFIDYKNLTDDHDLGFIFNNSYGKSYKISGDIKHKQVLIDASNSLMTRFDKNVGCIKSWDTDDDWQSLRGWKFPVIIDNMMNLEMLFEVSLLTGNDTYKQVAISHANTTMKNHFRPDASSYHVIDYDPKNGSVLHRETAQGYANESAWSRGQSWGLYSFTMCYRYTKDKKYLDFAEKIANFILNNPNYPKDGVPYWDFNAPKIPNEPRDASSAAIIASGLLELNSFTKNDKYLQAAKHILNSLGTDAYTAKPGTNGNFVLMHSVGSIPHGNEIDVPLNYADYYYIEALSRLKEKGL